MFSIKYWPQNDSSAIDRIQDWHWPATDDFTWHGIKEDWVNSHHEKYFKYLDDHRTAVQAGGCCGVYPRLLAERFEMVYTFEPSPISFHCLVNNCQLEKVIKLQMALGDVPGQICMDYPPNSVGMARVHTGEVVGAVPVIPLDYLKLKFVDLIQIDVEGYEEQVLKGAQETIAQWKPVVIIEATNADKERWLKPHGYELVDTTGHADAIFKAKR